MKIVILDDKATERTLAIQATTERGLTAIAYDPSGLETKWTKLVEDADGVVTDLFWPHYHPNCAGKEFPIGLLVVIHCLSLGKPVVICTDVDKTDPEGHHGMAAGWIHDGYWRRWGVFGPEPEDKPFGWEDGKDWQKAIEQLTKRMGLASKQT